MSAVMMKGKIISEIYIQILLLLRFVNRTLIKCNEIHKRNHNIEYFRHVNQGFFFSLVLYSCPLFFFQIIYKS